jgi:hypothetical protein
VEVRWEVERQTEGDEGDEESADGVALASVGAAFGFGHEGEHRCTHKWGEEDERQDDVVEVHWIL